MVINHHFTVITKVMLLYNTEWWYDHGLVVNYCGKKFYNIEPLDEKFFITSTLEHLLPSHSDPFKRVLLLGFPVRQL
jgi:hypothetical protein